MAALLLVTTICFVAFNLIIGFWKLRSVDFEGFVSSRESFSPIWVAISIVGSVVGGGMFFTVTEMSFEAGTAVLALPCATILGILLLVRAAPIVKQRLATSGELTLYDFVKGRLGDSKLASLVLLSLAILFLSMYFFMLSGQFTVLAQFYVTMFQIPIHTAWLLSLGMVGASTLIYSTVGGIRKDIASDVLQVFFSMTGIILITIYLLALPAGEIISVPRKLLLGTGYGAAFPFAVFIFFGPTFLARFDFWQKIIACRGTSEARKALLWSIPFILLAYTVFCALGLFARSRNFDGATVVLPALQALLPEGAMIVVTLALYAAVMSSADTLLSVTTVSSHRLIKELGFKISDSLSSVRLLSVLIGVASSAVVLLAPNLVNLMMGAFSSLIVVACSMAALLFLPRVSTGAILLSLWSGYAVFLGLFAGAPALRKQAFIAAGIVAAIPIICSYFQPKSTRGR